MINCELNKIVNILLTDTQICSSFYFKVAFYRLESLKLSSPNKRRINDYYQL